MKRLGKRAVSMLLTLCMVVGLLPALSVEVEAANENPFDLIRRSVTAN